MPLDEYKTQVLILHSEQTTLDNLSSGFSDRYTVHCATSGSEALNTLVDTPINVLISAHDLPGMSGLDALREAKKRSPETIGILLAGNNTSDIEALVGDEEVFQVVSGQVTGDGLLRLVDNATRQMRLMALAESANDTTAGVDEQAEHIIMETSENGATIISDGTGRMPILDPKKVSAAANVGSRSVDVLVLTRDQEFLETIKDSSRGMHKVFYANTLGQANDAIRTHKIGVAVVDAAMVGEKIEQLTQHLRKGSPRLVSIVAGRRDDGEMLMDLINRGKVYRFLLKPVSPGRARLAVESSVKHHLEAPDAAFVMKGSAPAPTPKPAVAPTPKPAPVAAAKPKPKPQVTPRPAPVAAPKDKPDNAPVAKKPDTPADPPLGSVTSPEENSLIDDGLANAFGQDDTSFTETVTGLIHAVSSKFSSDDSDDKKSAAGANAVKRSVASQHTPTQGATAIGSGDGTGAEDSPLRNPKIMGAAAAAVVLLAVGAFWMFGGSDDAAPEPQITTARPVITDSNVATEPALTANADGNVEELLNSARTARDTGQLLSPDGDNALEYYRAALNADPGNALVADEFNAAIAEALALAETAIVDTRVESADAILSRVASVDPDNSRLPFLSSQLQQIQSRSSLDAAVVATRENRFEDANAEIASARSLGDADGAAIDAVAAELDAARSEQRVEDVLERAAARFDAGNLLSPPNDNARYYYELALSNDAGNTTARQGLSAIAGRLAFQARDAIDSGDFTAAEATLTDARAIDSTNTEVNLTTTALADARAAVADKARRDEQARQAALDQAEQARIAAEQQAEADNIAAAAATDEAVVADTPDVTNEAVATDEPAENTSGDALGAATAEPSAAATSEPAEPAIAAISSLKRTKYVAPNYPRSAERRNLSGWVDVVFTVDVNGLVYDVEVRSSEPGDVFVNSAVKAVEKWEFEPVVENGQLVERRAGIRLMFALE